MGIKGQIPWNKGKKLNYPVWNKGKKGTYSIKHSGQFNKGHIPWIKGKHHSAETIAKFKKSLIGRKAWNKGIKGLQSWHNISGFKPGWNKGKKMPKITGEKHFNWKGGRQKHKDGYILILKPDHPLADKKGYIMEHRIIMEQMLRRYLKKEERVHHINNIHNDNRPENLMYFPNESEHQKFHQILKH